MSFAGSAYHLKEHGQSEVESYQETNRPDTRIFSPLAVARLYVAIGHYWYLFKRLTAVSAGRFYRFEHIAAYSSGKVVAKSEQHTSSALRLNRWKIQFNPRIYARGWAAGPRSRDGLASCTPIPVSRNSTASMRGWT